MSEPHPLFLAAAYLLTALVILGMTAVILADRRALRLALAQLAKTRSTGDKRGE